MILVLDIFLYACVETKDMVIRAYIIIEALLISIIRIKLGSELGSHVADYWLGLCWYFYVRCCYYRSIVRIDSVFKTMVK